MADNSEVPHVTMHVLAQLGAQIDDRISDQLPRSVICHIAAAAGANDRNFFWREHIRFLTAATESVNMRMFDEEQNVGRGLALLGFDEPFLQLKRGEDIPCGRGFCEEA